MLGAIIGDIAGSRFERGKKPEKDFELFHKNSTFTDDTVLTCAIAKAILNCEGVYLNLGAQAMVCMQEIGRKYQNCGFGFLFYNWLKQISPKPYNSFGNGSAMRVSPVGFVAKSLEEAKILSKKVTEITHNHPEGLKGAEAVATAIWMAKNGKNKEEIKTYVEENYYKIPTSEDDALLISAEPTCQATVPKCFYAFLNSNSFEDAIKKAVSLGGDTDTIGAITGSIAESFYGIPAEMKEKALGYLPDDLKQIVNDFYKKFMN